MREQQPFGCCRVTWFTGPEAGRRARDYFGALKAGAIKIIRQGETPH
jgi:hypothetical protein